MKKVFYLLFIAIPFLLTACVTDEEDTTIVENNGKVVGTWVYDSMTPNVTVSGNALIATAATIALNSGLQSYASTLEYNTYVFKSDSTFVSAVAQGDTYGGTYSLVGDSLTLNYTSASPITFAIVTANDSVLTVKKSYMTEITEWASSIIGSFSGVEITSATITLKYTKQN